MRKSLSVEFMIGIAATIALAMGLTLIVDYKMQQSEVDKDLLGKAEVIAKEREASGQFLARSTQKLIHGDLTQPPKPSRMGTGADDIFAEMVGTKVKQTRLVVRNGKNEPDDFERSALIMFAEDPQRTEVHMRTVGSDGEPVFRYLTPLRAEASCLECHGEPKGALDRTGHEKEGMKEGDLAGAISVTLPLAPALDVAHAQMARMAVGAIAIAAFSLLLLWFLMYRDVTQPLRHLADVAASMGGGRIRVPREELNTLLSHKETAAVAVAFGEMSERLQEMYNGLEQRVAERTAQLQTANAELERSARLKSEFLAMISHEFRTPLTSILTFTELLLSGAGGAITNEQREYLGDVLESSNRLLFMINDLLDLTRVEAGKIKLFREVIDIRDLIRGAEQTIRPLAEKKQIRLITECAGELPLIDADGLRVTQVLLNLMGNAVKFTPPGGTITVSVRQADGQILVAVADNGIGIDPAEQASIFEAFRQSGRERPEGSGLGLTLARSMVELHGGRIWLDSEPGRGSTFWFTLPVLQQGRDGC